MLNIIFIGAGTPIGHWCSISKTGSQNVGQAYWKGCPRLLFLTSNMYKIYLRPGSHWGSLPHFLDLVTKQEPSLLDDLSALIRFWRSTFKFLPLPLLNGKCNNDYSVQNDESQREHCTNERKVRKRDKK